MSVQPILKVERLTKTYPTAAGALTVLKEVSFALEPGATCAIVGPSGSGKTTLLGLCAGLDQPTSGSVQIVGREVGHLNEDERALVRNESVGFVFQNFQLIPTLTALENVLVPLELRGDNTSEKDAADLLARVGLGDRLDHYPMQLSGGEQQRVAIARGLVNRPPVILADEPTAPLDSDRAMAVIRILNAMAKKFETAIIVVTHDEKIIPTFRRIYHIRDGITHEEAGEGRPIDGP